jgi:hypothetical protein
MGNVIVDKRDDEFYVESFAVWLLAAQLLAGSGVSKAIGLLPADYQDHISPTNIEIVAPTEHSGHGSVAAQMWTKAGDPKIYVANWTDVYKKAERGDKKALIQMAAQIAHELYHQDHGTGNETEEGAYDVQIKILKSLNAPKDIITQVENAKAYTLWGMKLGPRPAFLDQR